MTKPLRVLLVLLAVTVLTVGAGCRRAPKPAPPAEPPVPEARVPSSSAPPGGQEKPPSGEPGFPAGRQEKEVPVAPAAASRPEGKAAGAKAAGGLPATPERPAADSLVLWITRDFGSEVLKALDVKPAPGEQVLQVLAREVQIETAYGGGFVTRINGLGSGKPGEDWFYWVNGILAGIGAGEFPARPGDTVWWDFHPWNRTAFLPAVVGAYPEPFLHGYTGEVPPAKILFSAGAKDQAQAVAGALKKAGAPEPELAAYEEGSLLKRSAPTVLVATWPEVSTDKDLAGLFRNWRKTGLYIQFDGTGVAALGADGREAVRYEKGAGAVLATGSGPADPHPLWLILGTDAAGLKRAVQLLGAQPQELARRIGVVVGPSGQVRPLPAGDKA